MAFAIMSAEKLAANVCKALDIEPDRVSRIIVDMAVAQPVRVFVEMFGSTKLLDVDWTLDGAEITMLERPE